MDFLNFEEDFFSYLQNKNEKCLNLIETNKDLIEFNLISNPKSEIFENFVNKLSEIIISKKNKNLFKYKSGFELIENILNHPYLEKVKERIRESEILIKACKVFNKDAANWLSFNMKVNPYIQDKNGMTCLMYAAMNNYQSVIKCYMNDPTSLNLQDNNGNNVLYYSICCPQFFKKKSNSIDNDDYDNDDANINNSYNNNNNNNNNNNESYQNKLINSDIDINHVNNDGETVFLYSVKKNMNTRIFDYLLQCQNIDVNIPDNDGNTAAMYFAERGDNYNLIHLHKWNCNYNYINFKNNQSVLSILINKINGSEKERNFIPITVFTNILFALTRFQVNFNIPVDNDGNTAFMAILKFISLDFILLCTKFIKNLDLSVKNIYGENATSLCFKLKYYDVLKLLKDNPTFDINYRDPINQNTLLILSVMNDCTFLKELLEMHPDTINEVNNSNQNALIIACKINQLEGAEKILNFNSYHLPSHNIIIDQQDNLGNTALHYAVITEKYKLVSLLLSKDPNINLKNNEGKTITDFANEVNNSRILALLNNQSSNVAEAKFEANFFSKLQKKDNKCLKLLESHKDLIENYLNVDINSIAVDNFVNKINEIILDTKTKNLLSLKNEYKVIENVLNHPYLSEVKRRFQKSDILIRACEERNKKAAKWLLTMNINPLVRDKGGRIALMLASSYYAMESIADDLIKMNENQVNLFDNNGNTPLFYAIKAREIFEDLIKYKIDINHRNHQGDTIFTHICRYNKPKLIQSLITYHSDIDFSVVNDEGKTGAMYLALFNQYTELRRFLPMKEKLNLNYKNKNDETVVSLTINHLYDRFKNSEFNRVITVRDTFFFEEQYCCINHDNTDDYLAAKYFARTINALIDLECDFNCTIDGDGNTPFLFFLMCKDYVSAINLLRYCKTLDLNKCNKYEVNASYLCSRLTEEDFRPLKHIKNYIFVEVSYKKFMSELESYPTYQPCKKGKKLDLDEISPYVSPDKILSLQAGLSEGYFARTGEDGKPDLFDKYYGPVMCALSVGMDDGVS